MIVLPLEAFAATSSRAMRVEPTRALEPAPAVFGPHTNEGNTMAKTRDSKKQTKKPAAKTPQQKRAAKREKRSR